MTIKSVIAKYEAIFKLNRWRHTEALEVCGQTPLRLCFECLSMTLRTFIYIGILRTSQ